MLCQATAKVSEAVRCEGKVKLRNEWNGKGRVEWRVVANSNGREM